MAGGPYVLALDSGSSSVRAVLVDQSGSIISEGRAPVLWKHRHPGWAELDPVLLWRAAQTVIREAIARAGARDEDITAVGITTHRETAFIWDKRTGEPVYDAVVWISHQTDGIVARWDTVGLAQEFRQRTGLRNDSFFSAAKIAWLLENVPGVRERAASGDLAFGTPDAWLLWNLTGGPDGGVHATDPSCASRTALLNLSHITWDTELCAMLDIPIEILPELRPSDAHFGRSSAELLANRAPVTAVIADQQAGMFGQACFEPGSVKNTFGTAGVLTVNTGPKPKLVDGLTSSVAWTVQGKTDFELEGVVFHSGQTLSWLRDSLGVLANSSEINALSSSVPDTGGAYLVPAFGGMCAPYWDRSARATIVGLSLASTKAHVVRAGLEAMAYQTVDILHALATSGFNFAGLKVDGGAATSDLLCQFLADVSGISIIRPRELERTALGVAYAAGFGVGTWDGPDDVARGWQLDRTFEPSMPAERRDALYAGWQDAVGRTLTAPAP